MKVQRKKGSFLPPVVEKIMLYSCMECTEREELGEGKSDFAIPVCGLAAGSGTTA